MQRLMVFLFLIFLNRSVFANICTPDLAIFYGNGVLNSTDDAQRSLVELLKNLKKSADKEYMDRLTYTDVMYNYSRSAFSDLLEVYEQKYKESQNYDSFWDWFDHVTDPPTQFEQWYNYNFVPGKFIVDVQKENLTEQVTRYLDVLNANYRVLTVAHSQGNLFFNQSFDVLSHNGKDVVSKLGTVAVATPASYVANRGPYITLYGDKVIKSLGLVSSVLAPNTSNPKSDKHDWLNHDFLQSYLWGSASGPKIVAQANAQMKELFREKEEHEKDASKSCYSWFRSLKADTKDKDKCIMRCATASVDMGTFNCPMSCAEFCECDIETKLTFE